MLRRISVLVAALAIAGAIGATAIAADLRNVLGDYGLTSWGQKDGLNSSVIWSLAQDHDGYIWLGTDAGPVRFDGVRFTPLDQVISSPLANVSVRAISVSRDGAIFFGLAEPGGIARLRGSELKVFGVPDGLAEGGVTVLFEDSEGVTWAGNRAGLHRMVNERWEKFGSGLPAGPLYSVYNDRGGNLFVGTPVGVFKRPAGVRDFQQEETFDSQVRGVAEDGEGKLWVTDPLIGLRRMHERALLSPTIEKGRGSKLLRDGRGNFWVGTSGQGLWRVRPATSGKTLVERTSAATGFSDDGVTALIEDREGNIWAGTLDGLNRLTPHKMTAVLNLGPVSSVDATADGQVWVGTPDALVEFTGGDIERRRDPRPLIGAPLGAMHADERGALWIATNRNLLRFEGGEPLVVPLSGSAPRQITSMTSDFNGGVWAYDLTQGLVRWNGGRFISVPLPDDVKKTSVVSSYSDRHGRAWFGLADGRVAVADSESKFKLFGPEQGLTSGPYRAIVEDQRNVVWLGGNSGLTRFDGHHFATIRARREFPIDSLTAIVDDEQGHLWLATEGEGIIRVYHEEIDRALANPSHAIQFSKYDKFDGFAGTPRWFGNRSAVRARDGRLWFVAGRGITVIDPDDLGEVKIDRFPVRIEAVAADDLRFAVAANLALAPRTTRVEIDYTVLNLTTPLKTNFRYKLEGFDPEWVEAGTRRQAFYTNLPPRAYQFRVVASKIDGTWDEPGATLAFTIRPMFYQTTGFMIVCAVGLVLAVGGAWRLHLRRLRKEFSLLIGERARLSREIHDTLLQSLFGVALQCDAMARDLFVKAPHLKDQFTRMRHDVEDDIREARQSIWNLRSPRLESNSLDNALREVGEHATASTQAAFAFELSGTPRQSNPDVDAQLLRIGREAVSNAVRHARASKIQMKLAYTDREIILSVRDDGVGFDVATAGSNGHYGLTSMQERAEAAGGTFKLESRPGQGTVIEAVAPHA
jgi:signal transduction histidine kinase/ligand-binding sensor domain-containing protein